MSKNSIYVLMDVKIKDQKKFAEYREGHHPSLLQYGGKILFRSNTMESIEGNWNPTLFVVHEWPSEGSFKAWYSSKEYAPWKKLRDEAMDINMVLAKNIQN